jgi:arylsulfatase A-like enzyme
MTRSWSDWSTQQAVDKALEFLSTRDRGQQFFLNIGSQQPHSSTWHQFADSAVAPEEVWLPLWMPDTPQLRTDHARFQAAIRYMDTHFGRFMEGLKAMGHGDDTIVVFTTDHGISGPRSKGFLYERGTEITLMVRLPGALHGGQRRDQLIANVDFRPTWLELLGIDVPQHIQGTSFAEAVHDPEWKGQDAIFSERNFHGEKLDPDAADWTDLFDPMRAIRTQEFHYIRNFIPDVRPCEPLPVQPSQQLPRNTCELYDLRHDPQELINVAYRPEYARICSLLDQRLQTLRSSAPRSSITSRSAELILSHTGGISWVFSYVHGWLGFCPSISQTAEPRLTPYFRSRGSSRYWFLPDPPKDPPSNT